MPLLSTFVKRASRVFPAIYRSNGGSWPIADVHQKKLWAAIYPLAKVSNRPNAAGQGIPAERPPKKMPQGMRMRLVHWDCVGFGIDLQPAVHGLSRNSPAFFMVFMDGNAVVFGQTKLGVGSHNVALRIFMLTARELILDPVSQPTWPNIKLRRPEALKFDSHSP